MTVTAARRMDGIERTLIRQIFDSAPADAINLGLGQPDLPTPSRISLTGAGAIASGRTAYTSTAGDPALREAVARRYAPFATGPESVLIAVGSQEAVFATVLTLLFWILFISAGMFVIFKSVSFEIFWIASIPLTYFLCHYFVFSRKKKMSGIIFTLLLLLVIIFQAFNLAR